MGGELARSWILGSKFVPDSLAMDPESRIDAI